MAACRLGVGGPAAVAHNWTVFEIGSVPSPEERDGAVM